MLHSWITKEGWLAKYSGGQPGKPGTRKKVMHLEICKDIAERAGYYRLADNIGIFIHYWPTHIIVNITSCPYSTEIAGNIQVVSFGGGTTPKDWGRSLYSLFLYFCF